MSKQKRPARRKKSRKNLKYTRVVAVHIVTVDNIEEMAKNLHQTMDDMVYALAAADLMHAQIQVTEYFDRYELDLVKKQDPTESPKED